MRSFLLGILSFPYWFNPKIIRMELFAYALCKKPERYRQGNKFFAQKGLLDTCPYGETPLITLERMAKFVGINEQSRVMDMGAGAGRAAAFWAIRKKCHITCVEQNPFLISIAKRLMEGCSLTDRASFIQQDMLTLVPKDIDIIYFYHSALDDNSIAAIAENISQCNSAVKIITVSYALNEVLPGAFKTEQQFDGWFPWGMTWVYIQSPIKKRL